MNKVTIIGGGFSGLVTAFFFIEKGYQVKVIEKSPRFGGVLETKYGTLGPMELAANGIYSSYLMEKFIEKIDLDLAPFYHEAKNKYIYRNGPSKWPLSFSESFKMVKILLILMVRGKKSLAPNQGELITKWGERNLGAGISKYTLYPFLQGVYAGDPEKLSAHLLLSSLFAGKKSAKPTRRGTIVPKGGMEGFINTLKRFLEMAGCEFSLNEEFSLKNTPDHPHIICTSAPEASKILQNISPDIAKELSKIRMLDLGTAHLFYKNEEEKRLKGFGLLFPKEENFFSLGVLFNQSIAPTEYPIVSERWIFGGALNPSYVDFSDSAIIDHIFTDRKKVFSVKSIPDEIFIHRRKKVLPHYDLQLEKLLDQKMNLPSNTFLMGNYLGGIGLPKILEIANKMPERVEQKRSILERML